MTPWPISCALFLLALGLAEGVDLDCPPFWTRYGDNCYRFFGLPKKWQSAEDHCQEFFTRSGQGHLASIHSSGEDSFLLQLWKTSLVPQTGELGKFVWLGGNDLAEEGTFVWSDGTNMTYQGWRDGQPDNKSVNQHCGCFWEFAWDDFGCHFPLPYLCKMPINAV
ncbi:alpha-N-acetylgalactosamine-specific lectin-like [Acanthaster planci]|uniref:Alpha-N-acetylgalactosamine-specific lectin-like n=1 Tax=Acanthaster planci TaxID=133434 RepID=A0A8B8A059_ACAPL|nr:alpha-N-acetylgalactosamine-specific lectin-like [Acanthaster planci]